jgi:uncharacterized membrane protein YphA (DoxX/SURF4 family)
MINTRFGRFSIFSFIAFPIRIYLGIVFLMACYHKLLNPASFALDVASYQFLPLEWINLFAITVPMIELIIGVFIIIGFQARAAAWVMVGLMLAFIIALGWALAQGLDMSCGCFASQSLEDDDPITMGTMVRDFIWFGLALLVSLGDRTPLGVDYFLTKRRISDEKSG